MAYRNIIKDGNSFLRKKSREVSVFDSRLHTLIDDMTDTLREAGGVGLAAVQVGVLRRVIIIDRDEGDFIGLVNPVIIRASAETNSEAEGCLSFPNEFGMVERPSRVKVQAQDKNGELFIIDADGLTARAFCHEIDHLNGVLFVDLATEMLDPEECKAENASHAHAGGGRGNVRERRRR